MLSFSERVTLGCWVASCSSARRREASSCIIGFRTRSCGLQGQGSYKYYAISCCVHRLDKISISGDHGCQDQFIVKVWFTRHQFSLAPISVGSLCKRAWVLGPSEERTDRLTCYTSPLVSRKWFIRSRAADTHTNRATLVAAFYHCNFRKLVNVGKSVQNRTEISRPRFLVLHS